MAVISRHNERGLPNGGKSTLLRAMSKSRAQVVNWGYKTLQPNIGTVILDDHRGGALASATYDTCELNLPLSSGEEEKLSQNHIVPASMFSGPLSHFPRRRNPVSKEI